MVNGRDQAGSITVIMLAVLSMAMITALALFALGQIVIGRTQAQAHADLAAIYTAELIWNEFLPAADACAKSASYLAREGFSLQECREGSFNVQISILRSENLWGLGSIEVDAISRAGTVIER